MACMILFGLLVLSKLCAAALPAALTIRMDNLAPYYRPSMLIVTPGAPIKWMNSTASAHSVTHDGCTVEESCMFDSGVLQPDAQYEIGPLPPGRYPYHCRIHPIMHALLIVGDSTDGASGSHAAASGAHDRLCRDRATLRSCCHF